MSESQRLLYHRLKIPNKKANGCKKFAAVARSFLAEPVNQQIAQRAAQIFVRQRMEGENDLGSRDCDRDRDASV